MRKWWVLTHWDFDVKSGETLGSRSWLLNKKWWLSSNMVAFSWQCKGSWWSRHCRYSDGCLYPLRSLFIISLCPSSQPLYASNSSHLWLHSAAYLPLGNRKHFDKTSRVLKMLGELTSLGDPLANDWQCGDMKAQLTCLQLHQLRDVIYTSEFLAGSGHSWNSVRKLILF